MRLIPCLLLCLVVGCSSGDDKKSSGGGSDDDSSPETVAQEMLDTWVYDRVDDFLDIAIPTESELRSGAKQKAEKAKEPLDEKHLADEVERMKSDAFKEQIRAVWKEVKERGEASGVKWADARYSRLDYAVKSLNEDGFPELTYTVYFKCGEREYAIESGIYVQFDSKWHMNGPPTFVGPVAPGVAADGGLRTPEITPPAATGRVDPYGPALRGTEPAYPPLPVIPPLPTGYIPRIPDGR